MSSSEDCKEFLCNTLLIKALLQFLPYSERRLTQEWLSKLQDIEDSAPESKARNEYAFYLLVNVQNGALSQPFDKCPPSGKLRPLCVVLPDFLYEDVIKQLKVSYCRMNKMLNVNNDNYEIPELRCDPAAFHNQMPKPNKGVTALFAAFSNYEDDENKGTE